MMNIGCQRRQTASLRPCAQRLMSIRRVFCSDSTSKSRRLRVEANFYSDVHDDLRLIVLPFMPLWGVAGFHVVEAPISACFAMLERVAGVRKAGSGQQAAAKLTGR